MARNPFLAIDKRILGDSGTSGECFTVLHHLCDKIGPRFAGTEGYRLSAEYMLKKFKQYKLDNARLEAFDIVAWKRGKPAEFKMLKPSERSYSCYAMPYGASTGKKAVKARVVDIGAGSKEEIRSKRKKIKGRFAMTTATADHRTVIYQDCVAAGAVGLIIRSTTPGEMLPTGHVAGVDDAAIPAVGIGMESASSIGRLLEDSDPLFEMFTDSQLEDAQTWNVVAELKGTEFPEELVLMGGHLDSHEISHGAHDNAAGAVQVLEAARLLAKQRKHLKRTVRFICFGAEEIGLLGSHHHAKKHSAALRKARFMLNSDCPQLGNPKGLVFHQCPKGENYIKKISEQIETPIPVRQRFHKYSDHYPFILQGLPTAGMISGDFSYGVNHFVHMAGDTADKISLTDLRDGAAFAARMLLRASSDEDWPKMRRSKAAIKKLVS